MTWSQDQKLYVVIDDGDRLYEVDASTGAATLIGTLTTPVSTVGVENHPETNTLYVCGASDSKIHRVNKADATTTPLMSGPPTCTNLGAPWSSGSVCIPPVG